MTSSDKAFRDLGAWLARGGTGTLVFSAEEQSVRLRLDRRRILTVAGLDRRAVESVLGAPLTSADNILEAALGSARARGLGEPAAASAVKKALQSALGRWLADPSRQVTITEQPSDGRDAAVTLSLPHLLVELVLSADSQAACALLGGPNRLLRPADDFEQRFEALRLAEGAAEAVSRLGRGRLVSEASSGDAAIEQLYAALMVAGFLVECDPPSQPRPEVTRPEPVITLAEPAPEVEPPAQKSRTRTILIAGITLASLVAVVILAASMLGESKEPVANVNPEMPWSIIIDEGCTPDDLDRILKKAHSDLEHLKPNRHDTEQGSCWELGWGAYATREEAEAAFAEVPARFLDEGVSPRAVDGGASS